MCLPQILRQTLAQFHWQQICRACEELQIHCAPCSSSQLIALKTGGYLPVGAQQCGLITKSDAERLTSYLLLQQSRARELEQGQARAGGSELSGASDSDSGEPRKLAIDESAGSPDSKENKDSENKSDNEKAPSSPKTNADDPAKADGGQSPKGEVKGDLDVGGSGEPNLEPLFIQHECFGIAKGVLRPRLYTAPDAKCIQCSDCREYITQIVLPSQRLMGAKTLSKILKQRMVWIIPFLQNLQTHYLNVNEIEHEGWSAQRISAVTF